MILTLTGNLLAERTLEFPAGWKPGATQRAARETFQVGGKGVNVSKMLSRLGARTQAVCFAGGATGDECLAWLRAHGLEHVSFRTSAPTRAGAVVRTPGNAQPETTFLGPDVAPDSAALAACAAWLDAQPVTHALAFCGSFPGWDAPAAEPVRDAIARRIVHGNVYIDTYGAPLAWFAERPVALVKINRREFDQLCEQTNSSATNSTATNTTATNATALAHGDMRARLAAACERWPVRHWIVTDGPGPVWYATRGTGTSNTPVPASIQPPPIHEVSATGSGDVLLACVLHAITNQNFTLAEALKVAIPYASANASSSGIAEINKN